MVHFGSEPEVIDSTVSGKLVSFEATGFSVYALVDINELILSEGAVTDETAFDESMLFLCVANGSNLYYFTSQIINSGNANHGYVIKKTAANDTTAAAQYGFEKVAGTTNQYKMYLPGAGGAKQYLRFSGTTNVEFIDSVSDATVLTVERVANTENKFWITFQNGSTTYYLNMRGSTNGKGFNGSTYGKPTNDSGSQIMAKPLLEIVGDPYDLDGREFGLSLLDTKNAKAYSMTSVAKDAKSLKADELTIRKNTLYQNESVIQKLDGDIELFTFHYIEGEKKYYITQSIGGNTKYLSLSKSGNTYTLSFVNQPTENSKFTISVGTSGKIKISNSAGWITYSGGGFVGASSGSFLYLTEPSYLTDDDFVHYSAVKVSVSDDRYVYNGAKVVVYTRVWNDTTKEYEFYAIGHDGSLVSVYDAGSTIRWEGTQFNTLLWDLTEYYYAGTTTPNYYYELQNEYSGMYIAPQAFSGQIISGGTIGINLNGRRWGEYSTTIVAWDDARYDYAGLSGENGELNAVPYSQAQEFYFAVMDELDEIGLSTVETLDNADYGINMRMVLYPRNKIYNNGGKRNSLQTGTLYTNPTQSTGSAISGNFDVPDLNLVSNDMRPVDPAVTGTDTPVDEYYPVAVKTGKSLYALFGQATEVDNIFAENIHNESGYFQYDSSQNFATLVKDGEITDTFTVYNQLGTINISGLSQGHGQFMPYNPIGAPVASDYVYHTNLFKEEIPVDNPRRGEVLYKTTESQMNYFFGMVLEANFMQPEGGLDQYGHDIIYEFAGDDDMWLYLDNELVLDIGGIHSSLMGTINFSTGVVQLPNPTFDAKVAGSERYIYTTLRQIFTDNYNSREGATAEGLAEYIEKYFGDGDTFRDFTSHTMTMYYMERGASMSNQHMRFNLVTVPKGELILKKTISGTDKQNYSALEFPFQIWYKDTDDNDTWKTVSRAEDELGGYHYSGANYVYYDGTERPVDYAANYQGYENVFFLKPRESLRVQFPDEDVEYFIRECFIDTVIYDSVKANSAQLTGTPSDFDQDQTKADYSTEPEVIGFRKSVTFDNHVSENSLKNLSVTKRLYDEKGNRLSVADDPTGFRFRVYMGEGLDYYRMDSYYIRDPDGYYCKYDPDTQQFISLGISDFAVLSAAGNEDLLDRATFTTSPSGAIDKIPADYTFEIRNILVGTEFKIEERKSDIPKGYSLIQYLREDNSYLPNDGNQINSGIVRDRQSPHVIVENVRGFGLTVEKFWSDDNFMDSHDNIWFAVYYNGGLIPGTLRQMKTEITETNTSAESSVYYYFETLIDGAEFSDYVVKEIQLTEPHADPVVDEEGYVTNENDLLGCMRIVGGDVKLENGGVSSDTGEYSLFRYSVSYLQGEPTGYARNVRTDNVSNVRPGVRIVKIDYNGAPLSGVKFTLTDAQGNDVSESVYTSGADGLVLYAYPLEDVPYTLTETQTPAGYTSNIGPITFTLSGGVLTVEGDNNGAVSVEYDDETGEISLYVKNYKSSFTAVKVDSVSGNPLKGAHFALYRRIAGVNGLIKDFFPINGYDNIVTNSAGVLPGINETFPVGGYYLVETDAPAGYSRIDHDIIFTVDKTGKVEIVSEQDRGLFTSTVDPDTNELVYALTIPDQRSFVTVDLSPQTFVADFGLDIEYNVKDNNYMVPAGSVYSYIGVYSAEAFDAYGSLTPPKEALRLAAPGEPCEGDFGTLTLSADGATNYKIGSMEFTGEDVYCLAAEVTNIGGKALKDGEHVYVFEKITYLPATTIYYEDDFVDDTHYIDGVESTVTGYNFGKWSTVTGTSEKKSTQAADFAGLDTANIFGYDPNYTEFATYSNNSAHKVSVSTVNSGNKNKNWPYVEYTFAGTGFDVISVTSGDTGIFTVRVYDAETGAQVIPNQVIDTYYGYDYGSLYLDSTGNPTLQETDSPLYSATEEIIKTASSNSNVVAISGMFVTPTTTYIDTDGSVTETPYYRGADDRVTDKAWYKDIDTGDVISEATLAERKAGGDDPDRYVPNYSYAHAEGWVINPNAAEALYQIPVIKVRGLEYGAYRARIEPRFGSSYKHYKTLGGYNYFDLYVDAFRVYDPAGVDGSGAVSSAVIQDAYNLSDEAYAKYTSLKNVVIGSDTMGSYFDEDKQSREGSVIVDGNVVLSTERLEDYKKFGPLNELYLSHGMSVAFEICASEIPADVQIRMKKISAADPTFRITYVTSGGAVFTNEVEIHTSTDLSYSIMDMIGKKNITWSNVKGTQDVTSGLVIISNTGTEESIISVTDLKWTFADDRGQIKVHNGDSTVLISNGSLSRLKRVLSFSKHNLAAADNSSAQGTYEDGVITMTVTTGADARSLVVRDQVGGVIDESLLDVTFEDLDDEQRLWTVTVAEQDVDSYTFLIAAERDGLVTGEEISLTVDVETAQTEEPEDGSDGGEDTPATGFAAFAEKLRGFWFRLIELIKRILAFFNIVWG
ncbi:MAG: hypothetical protein K6G90_06015 [Clostridia bacterium]|nr:hypothetical protein [Clostridia bacterium]